jgi:aspartyl-tRNA(Asn)/glutamyl-tRNA(Gln) amidotransferase subunit A
MTEEALADARSAGDEIASGRYRGPLHGVPIGVKDLCATKGVRTTAGSKILADSVPDEDATVVRRLRDAGAVIVGKTNLHEFAYGATGTISHYGPAHNPWDTTRITGGSSSGSGAAVAAGLCFAALGSDTGGSIRIPSSLCGIVGIKPSYGRVSLAGVVPLAWSLDHVGPMARAARDCALVLEAIAGRDPKDPSTVDEPVEGWASGLDDSADGSGLTGMRIGVPAGHTFEQTEPEVAAVVREAITTLGRLGAEVRELDLPALESYWMAATMVLIGEAAAYHQSNAEQRPGDWDETTLARVRLGLEQKAADHIRAARLRDEARRTSDATLLSEVDLLAMPTAVRAAPPIDSTTRDDPTVGLTRLTAAFDLTGQPACSVPCGFTKEGLPVGLQLVGRRFDEMTVLRAAHIFETQSGIPRPHPPVD